jgi:hypothetical protein
LRVRLVNRRGRTVVSRPLRIRATGRYRVELRARRAVRARPLA